MIRIYISSWWGCGVKPVDTVKNIDYDFVIVTPTEAKEIYEQLLSLGVKKDKILDLYDVIFRAYYTNENYDIIYAIGDSHVSFFSSANLHQYVYKDEIGICRSYIKPFKTFHLGPALAHNLNKYGTTTNAREKIEYILDKNIIPKGANILCVFGEIDIRTQVYKQVELRKIDFNQAVDEIVEEYVKFLQRLSENYKVFVWCPVASQRDDCFLDVNYPRVGTQFERNKATEYFEEKVKKKCSELKIGQCLSIFSSLIDEEYVTKDEFYQDPVHLSSKAWIFAKDELKKAGIICERI